jgi:hypothetical protein
LDEGRWMKADGRRTMEKGKRMKLDGCRQMDEGRWTMDYG